LALQKLQTLLIACYGITDEAITQLDKLPLRHLDVSRSGVSDRGMRSLARMKTLKNLNLSRTVVGDKGVEALAQSNSIQALDLVQTAVTVGCAASLSKMKSLREIFVDSQIANSPDFSELAKSLPLCYINRSNPAVHTDGSPSHLQVQPSTDASLQEVPVQVDRLKEGK
jgi:Leucine Rich repeat